MAINFKNIKLIHCVLLYLLIKSLIITNADSSGSKSSNQIRIGAVLSTQGPTDEMLDAYKGYKLAMDLFNGLDEGKGMKVLAKAGTPVYYFKFNFTSRDDMSDHEEHDKQVKELLDDEKVHFLFGSHPVYAKRETEMANDADVFNLHCCVGPDSYYKQNYKYVFGVQASNTKYSKLLIKTLALEGIRKFAFAYEASQEFTKTTCEAAYNYAAELMKDGIISSIEPYDAFNENDDKDVFMKEFAKKIKEDEIEAVFGCLFRNEGKKLVNAINDIEYPLKAFFVTIGPTKEEWVHDFDQLYRVDNLLSSSQWHKELDLKDDMFGSTYDYVELFQNKYNTSVDPSYIAAGASAMGYVLYEAFQNAFKNCDLSMTNGDINELLYNKNAIKCDDSDVISGYARIRQMLKSIDMITFFGRIKFDHNQRNMGLEPVTTQVFYNEDELGMTSIEIDAVLPLDIANSILKVPAKNYYKKDCPSGSYQNGDEFDGCVPCEPGKISFNINAEHCVSCDTGSWISEKGQSKCNDCPNGTTTKSLGSTSILNCTCIIGYYHPNGNNMGEECLKCPHGAICDGYDSLPSPLPGYWFDPNDISIMYKCDPSSLCEGGPNSQCRTGYTGRLCAECDDGYFSLFERCRSCFGLGGTIMMIIALVWSWYIMNVTVSRNVSSVEMLLNWVQLANIIGDIDLDWPRRLNVLFGIANILDFDVDILEPSCFISWSYTQNLIVQLLLPFLMSCLAAFGFLSSYFLYKLSTWHYDDLIYFSKKYLKWIVNTPDDEFHLKEKWDKTLAAFLASVEITFVTICKYCFDAFKCETIAGKSVLKASPDIECGTTEHIITQILGSFGILIYVIFYTVLISLKLYSLNSKSCFSDVTDLNRFGFLYKKFELEYYFTPIIITIRKILFVFFLVFFNNPAFQAGAMAVVINASLMIHVYTAPYIDTYLDWLFSFLLVTLMFLAFGGLMFSSDLLSATDRDILEWLVLFTFFVLCTVFIVIFVLEIQKKYHIRYLKKLQLQAVSNDDLDEASVKKIARILSSFTFLNSPFNKDTESKVNFELLETFHPGFIYKAVKEKKELILEWNKLTNILADYMSDQADTSYLSMLPIAKFWRKFANKFPIIIDFLAVADDDSRKDFIIFAKSLYKNFYLANKVITLPIFSELNWRDYGPMAHWLAISSNEDRRFLVEFMIKSFKASNKLEMAKTLEQQLENGGIINSLREINMQRLNTKKGKVAKYIKMGEGPFDHSKKFKTTAKSVENANIFINHLKPRKELSSKQEDTILQMKALNSSDNDLNKSQNTSSTSLDSERHVNGSSKNSEIKNSVIYEDLEK